MISGSTTRAPRHTTHQPRTTTPPAGALTVLFIAISRSAAVHYDVEPGLIDFVIVVNALSLVIGYIPSTGLYFM